MFSDLILPVVETASNTVRIIDLKEFPRAVFIGEKEGTTGGIKFFQAPAGMKVIAYDEGAGQPMWADVSGWSEHPNAMLVKVGLEAKRQIIIHDDSRAVYGIDPSAGGFDLQRYAPAQALERSVVVPIVRDTRTVMGSLGGLTSVCITSESSCAFAELSLTFDFGWMLGVICGDGWWEKRDNDYYSRRSDTAGLRSVVLSDLQGMNAARLENFIRRVLDPGGTLYSHALAMNRADTPGRYGDTVKHTYNFKDSELLAQFLDEHLGGARDGNTSGSANKHLPAFAFRAPEEFRRGLLCGLVDSDGSCSVSMGKDKAQLMISFCSTSHRLAQEVKGLCKTLGIEAAVSFSRTTDAGNTAWIVTISAVDAKRSNVFAALACDSMRNNFNDTDVSDLNTSVVFEKVVVPHFIYELINHDLPKPKIYEHERRIDDRNSDLRSRMNLQSMSVLWREAGKRGVISRVNARRVLARLEKQTQERTNAIRNAVAALEPLLESGGNFTQELADTCRDAIRGISPKHDSPERYKAGCGIAARLNGPLRVGKCGPKVIRGVYEFLTCTTPYQNASHAPAVLEWITRFLNNETISWSPVISVEPTESCKVGYDLIIPGFGTFMSADGIILSNTSSPNFTSPA